MRDSTRQSVRLRRLVASTAVLVYAVFAVLGGSIVSCREADGTTTIEWLGARCCAPRTPGLPSGAVATGDASERDGDCGGCLDQALADDHSTRAARRSAAGAVEDPGLPALPTALPLAFGSVMVDAPARSAGPVRTAHQPPCLEAIRSVVLRC